MVVHNGVIRPCFLDIFGAVAGLEDLHYAILLLPEQASEKREALRRARVLWRG